MYFFVGCVFKFGRGFVWVLFCFAVTFVVRLGWVWMYLLVLAGIEVLVDCWSERLFCLPFY